MTPTPGTYIRKRREAAGLSLDDLALRLETTPAVCARERAALLAAYEADITPLTLTVALALWDTLELDIRVLGQLVRLNDGESTFAPRLCRSCCCSEYDLCIEEDGAGCHWIGEDLCSSCEPINPDDGEEQPVAPPFDPGVNDTMRLAA